FSEPVVSVDVFTITVDLIKGLFTITSVAPFRFLWYFVNDPSVGSRDLFQMLGYPLATNIPPADLNTLLNNASDPNLRGNEVVPPQFFSDTFSNAVTVFLTPDQPIQNPIMLPFRAFS